MNRICLVVPTLTGDGGIPAVARFVKDAALNSGKYALKVVSLCMSSSDPCSVEFRRPASWLRGVTSRDDEWEGLPVIHVGAFFGELEFQRYRRRKALSRLLGDCDLIHVVSGSPAWANAVIGLGRPVSLQVATRAKIERHHRHEKPRSVVDWWRVGMTCVTDRLDVRALRNVEAIQVMNPWMLDYSKQVNAKRIGVDISYAPPGMDAALFHPSEDRLRDSQHPYILSVGRLDDPRKNVGMLLEALALLRPNLSHVHLVTAGAGEPPHDYWARVDALGLRDRVRHVHRPEKADLVRLFQHATAFALASHEEGFGVVLVEAMACGVPVVATACGGPDGIVSDGIDGFLVPVGDARAMADHLGTLCEDAGLNRKLGESARQTVESRYANGVAGQALMRVWGRLLAGSGGR